MIRALKLLLAELPGAAVLLWMTVSLVLAGPISAAADIPHTVIWAPLFLAGTFTILWRLP